MNSEYTHHAYQRSIAMALVRVVERDFLSDDVREEPKEVVVCEEVPYGVRNVPKEELVEFIGRLKGLAEREERAMREFKMVKRSNGTHEALEEATEESSDSKEGAQGRPKRKGKGRRRARKAGG
jgi:hypothetical protein